MTNTYNPILSKEQLVRFSRLVAEPGVALVLSGQGQPLLSITHNEKGLTTWERVSGKYSLLYKVDVTEHPLIFNFKLPCATDEFEFNAEIQLTCSIAEPDAIIRRNVTDVGIALKPMMMKVMRSISCNYEISQRKVAEQKIGASLETANYDSCFQLKYFILTLSLPEEIIQGKKEITKVLHQTNVEIANIKSRQQVEKEQQQLQQQQQIFDISQTREKINFYSEILKAGNLQMLALQLAQRPGDAQVIVQLINQQKQLEREQHVKMLKMLIDEDVIEGWQIIDTVKHQLHQMFGLPEQPMPPLAGRITDEPRDRKSVVIDQMGRNVLQSSPSLPPKPAPPPQITTQYGNASSRSEPSKISEQPNLDRSARPTSDLTRPQFNYDEDD
jgi:hypothetical protein